MYQVRKMRKQKEKWEYPGEVSYRDFLKESSKGF